MHIALQHGIFAMQHNAENPTVGKCERPLLLVRPEVATGGLSSDRQDL
jgi:hypothetical protein